MKKNPTNEILQYFGRCHEDTLKQPYMVNWGKDSKILKQTVELYGIDITKQLIDICFKTLQEDPFLQQTGITVGIFKTQIPKLIMKLRTNDIEEDESQKGKL